MPDKQHTCIVCKQSRQQIPLLLFEYQGQQYSICPQHLPILIHHPEQLEGLLPGAAKMTGYQT